MALTFLARTSLLTAGNLACGFLPLSIKVTATKTVTTLMTISTLPLLASTSVVARRRGQLLLRHLANKMVAMGSLSSNSTPRLTMYTPD